MVGDGEGARKDGAGFAVLSLAVAEEEGIRCAVCVPEDAALAHKAVGEGGVVLHLGAAFDDEVIGNYSMADDDGSAHVAGDGAVAETAGAGDARSVSYLHSFDEPGVADGDVVADNAPLRFLGLRICVNHLVEACNGLRMMAVHCDEICCLGAQAVVNLDFAATGLIHDAHLYTVAEAAGTVCVNEVCILDVAVLADVVVCDVVADVLYKGIVADRDVMEGDIPEAGMLLEAAGQRECRLEPAEFHLSGKADVPDIF